MLRATYYPTPTPLDVFVYTKVVPTDHYLRQVAQYLDFAPLRELLTPCYHPDHGRPAEDPIRLFKLGFLQFHYNLSDREVCAQTQVNLAFRWFLDLSLDSPLPDPTTLCVFRSRLGPDRYAELFAAIVAQARAAGLVKDRLRLTDATHIRANIAVPRTIELLAQTRHRLLAALEPFAPAAVAAAREDIGALRVRTHSQTDDLRLAARVSFLQELLAQAQAVTAQWSAAPPADWSPAQCTLQAAITLTERILDDRADPDAGDKVRSIVDPEARTGHHGGFYVGYLLDVLVDADSGLLTNLDLLAANGDETATATALITQEEQTHGNDGAALSIDGAGFRGDRLREWQDPAGLGLEVFVPAPPTEETPYFTTEQFIEDAEAGTLTCPAGETTNRRSRHRERGWNYTFRRVSCAGCPLQAACMREMPKQGGRRVLKNDYAEEYAAVRQKVTTDEYHVVRTAHRQIERKLGEMVGRHGGRRLRYRGRTRGRIQCWLIGLVVNIKRLVRLLRGQEQATVGI